MVLQVDNGFCYKAQPASTALDTPKLAQSRSETRDTFLFTIILLITLAYVFSRKCILVKIRSFSRWIICRNYRRVRKARPERSQDLELVKENRVGEVGTPAEIVRADLAMCSDQVKTTEEDHENIYDHVE